MVIYDSYNALFLLIEFIEFIVFSIYNVYCFYEYWGSEIWEININLKLKGKILV